MIAASEPLEFVPHGRMVVANHPTQIYRKGQTSHVSENSLLYKLTNFAIKDESLWEAKDAEEQEWWCIREVFYKASEELEEDMPVEQKDPKCDSSESFRPPSRLKTDFNISIKSEIAGVKKMETDSAGTSRGGSANSSSNLSKKFNVGSQSRSPKKKLINIKTDSSYEEELYVKGCTAVWSKGLISSPGSKQSGPEHRETICCYTIDNPIKHAAFVNFHVTINNTMLIDALNSQIGDVKKNIKIEDTTEHVKTKIMPSIMLIDTKCMRVFAKDGREYITSIPFQVKKAWPMKYGVLLEKDATPMLHNSFLPNSFVKLNESHNSSFSKSKTFPYNLSGKFRNESVSGFEQDVPLPTCFSLSHPLDEVTPILMKSLQHGLQYYNDGDLQIIFVSSTPSIILVYDWKLGIHSLWKIRKATRDECLSMCPNMNSTTTVFSQSCDFMASPMHSNIASNAGKNTTNWATGLASPVHSRKVGTPTMSRSRQNSPMASIFHQQGLSPHASIGQASSTSMLANTMVQTPPSLPLYPEICLDHVWSDSQTLRRDPIENDSDTKAFLHTDLVGHDYLCFMVKISGVSRLQIVRLQKSHTHNSASKTNLIVGSISTVLARDAVVVDHLKMMALIDEFGNIILQSGNNVVGKVHVGGVLARLIDSPYSKRSNFPSSFPRRSSLLPSRCHDMTLDDSALHLLSPVPHSSRENAAMSSGGVTGIRDASGSRVSLVLGGGAMCRVLLPAVAGAALVARCLPRSTDTLPAHVTQQVIIKWYGVRNAPGTQDLTPEQEWTMFSELLYSLIGYDVEKLSQSKNQPEEMDQVEVATKKQRTSSDGTFDDWDYLLNSKLHKTIGSSLAAMLNLSQVESKNSKQTRPNRNVINESEKHNQFNTNCLLFPYMYQILYSLHLVYEEIKLNTLLWSDLKPLAKFLHQLAKDLRLDKYVNHYWLDFPTDLSLEYDANESQITDGILKKLCEPSFFTIDPPNIFGYLNGMLKGLDVGYYPYLPEMNNTTKDIIEIVSASGMGVMSGVQRIWSRDAVHSSTPRNVQSPNTAANQRALHTGITQRDIDNLPPALGLLLLSIFVKCKADPPMDWPVEAYQLVMREDLALQAEIAEKMATTDEYMESLALEFLEKETVYSLNDNEDQELKPDDNNECITGMEHLNTKLLALLYPRDHRMTEVMNLLQSSSPVTINLTQRPEVSDHDFIEEQEKHLFAISTRTMALPIARGMLTLRTLPCSATEPLTLPKLCVTGKGPPPRCNTISMSSSEAPACSLSWPGFHSGAAAGLALVPMTGARILPSWITYNKPRGTAEMSTEHAGFLMALGLNGHLKDMPFMNIYEYLVKCNEMTSVGLLLGLAATYRGTMDVQATKMLSIHLEPLLPPTCIELDIQQNILVAALLGLGLLYQGTGHQHYASVLLQQIGKPYGPEGEHCVERYGYALAAGLALGMVCVGAGPGTHTHTAAALRSLMRGCDRTAPPNAYKSTGSSCRQGSTVNLDVTSPGATVALGLIYMKSNNAAIASWLDPPTTAYLLDFVRPDLLMLRIIARGLIMWDSIEPSEEWIESQVPPSIKKHCFVKPTEDNIDYEAMNQAYCNIIAGACFAVGLRFAGSGCEEARAAVLWAARLLLAAAGRSVAELAGRATVEACLVLCLLAAGMIMAGRGDIEVVRICRRLRARVSPSSGQPAPGTHQPLSHGGQMAVHCTLGLLFLGGGRATLSTSRLAVAALLAAFFPKFPTHSEDNRYHLQAFRHLYVLAVEERLILPRDLDTGKLCYAHIQVIDLGGVTKEMKAPCIIPELDTIKELRINDPRYWPVCFRRDANWEQLKTYLDYTWCIDIKQRAGCLSYLDDPHGFLTILAQTLTLDKSNVWSISTENIELFTNDEKIKNFVTHYLDNDENKSNVCADCLIIAKKKKGVKNEPFMSKECKCRKYNNEEQEYMQNIRMVTYECVIKDVMCALPIWTTFLKIIRTMKSEPTAYHMWQIKLLLSQIEYHNKKVLSEMKIDGQDAQTEPLISNEFILAIKQRVSNIFDSWEPKIAPFLRKYLGLQSTRKVLVCEDGIKKFLASFVVYHDLPKGVLRSILNDDELAMLLGLDNLNLSVEAVDKIESLCRI